MPTTETEEFVGCCAKLDPCQALCEINGAMLKIAIGGQLSSYKVGEETFALRAMSYADLERAYQHFQSLCNKASGKSRRLNLRFVKGRRNIGYGGSKCR